MADSHYDRLTQLDNSFLVYEQQQVGMHVATTQYHDAAPLRHADGSLDIDRIREYVVSRLDRIPRYRQRLAKTPLEGHPVWVDDPNFNILYHVRHSRLPRPGSERQLKRMVGRIFSQILDRGKPLWEMWVIEGLEGDRLAILSKVHHCMVDGVSGAELIAALLTAEPQEKVDPPGVWNPRPAPSRLELGAGEVARAIRGPLRAGETLLHLARDDDAARQQLAQRLRAAGRMLADTTRESTPVPFNQPIGPYRRIDWTEMPIDRIRTVRHAVGGSLNDVVLATAAGGIAHYLRRTRGVDLDDVHFQIMAPVSMHTKDDHGTYGNRVSAWNVELPLAERDPISRLDNIREQTERLKKSGQAAGAETLMEISEWTGSGLLSLGARLMNYGTPFNMVITNVPGPQLPLYLLESRMLEIHPHLPLLGTLGIGIALFSYDGSISWGLSADWNLVPDLHDLVLGIQDSFEQLCEAAVG
jgi:WS/DGAT/MGAT family acyltransferase